MGHEVKCVVTALDGVKFPMYPISSRDAFKLNRDRSEEEILADPRMDPVTFRYMTPEEKIERAGRICYNSEDRICLGSAEKFVRGVMKRGHESVIEHEGICVEVETNLITLLRFLTECPVHSFIQVTITGISQMGLVAAILSGNFRTWRDHFRWDPKNPIAFQAMQLISEKTPLFSESIPETACGGPDETKGAATVTFIGFTSQIALETRFSTETRMKHGTFTVVVDGVSRAMTHQFVRHRPVAFSQRSQRYCGESDFNYVVPPDAMGELKLKNADRVAAVMDREPDTFTFSDSMQLMGHFYSKLQGAGLKNEDARFVLPNACETNIVATATLNQWLHMINLRTSKHAQWEIREAHRQICHLLKEHCPGLPFDSIEFE